MVTGASRICSFELPDGVMAVPVLMHSETRIKSPEMIGGGQLRVEGGTDRQIVFGAWDQDVPQRRMVQSADRLVQS